MAEQDFLADIRAVARDMLKDDPTSGRAAILLGLVGNAERERAAELAFQEARVTGLQETVRVITRQRDAAERAGSDRDAP